jgi:hypothetical protein
MCEWGDSQDVVEQSGIRPLRLAMSHAQVIEILVGYEQWLTPMSAQQQSNETGEGAE